VSKFGIKLADPSKRLYKFKGTILHT
jgi:hypothetical protein